MRPAVFALRGLVLCYRYTLSALIGRSCRFVPSCSEYALDALDRHGAARGSWLTLRRLARCHPWGGAGLDPVPEVEATRAPVIDHAVRARGSAQAAATVNGGDSPCHGLRADRPDTR